MLLDYRLGQDQSKPHPRHLQRFRIGRAEKRRPEASGAAKFLYREK